MATDQEIRDKGYKYIPQQKYLLNPFEIPVQGGGQDASTPSFGIPNTNAGGNPEGFSVYNPDPNRTRNESNYNPRTYNKVMRDTDKFGETVMPNPDLYYTKELEGIPGMVQGYMKNSLPGRLIGNAVSGLESLLPVNRRAIYENELLGQGIMLDDIGRIVSDGGNINTAENIMAGYNANKVTAETFQKRRDMIKAKMKDPAQKAAKLAALDAAEAKMLGTATDRADMVFEDKMITKDPSLKGPGYLENAFDFTTEEDDEEFNPLDPKNKSSIYTATAPTYLDNYPTNITGSGDGTGTTGSVDPAGINTIDSTVYADNNNEGSTSTSGLTYTQGGGQDGSYDFVEQNFTNPGSSYNPGYNTTGKGIIVPTVPGTLYCCTSMYSCTWLGTKYLVPGTVL